MTKTLPNKAGFAFMLFLFLMGTTYFIGVPIWEMYKASQIKNALTSFQITPADVIVDMNANVVVILGIQTKKEHGPEATQINIGQFVFQGSPDLLIAHMPALYTNVTAYPGILNCDRIVLGITENTAAIAATNLTLNLNGLKEGTAACSAVRVLATGIPFPTQQGQTSEALRQTKGTLAITRSITSAEATATPVLWTTLQENLSILSQACAQAPR